MSDDYNFSFGDDFEDISSFSNKPQKEQYEDIVSDSGYNNIIGRSAQPAPQGGGRHSYRKKKRGFAGFVSDTAYKIKRWWVCLKKGQRAAFVSVTSVVLVLAIFAGWFFANFSYNYKHLKTDDLGFEEVIDDKIVNVALFGIDTRDEKSFKGLSDSIMILSLNTKTKKVKVISFMRDTLVPYERDGKTYYAKLNTPYSKGGAELAVKTLNKCFNLDISEYATVNFYGMADIIDAVGGIEVTLTDNEVKARGANNHGINDMIEEICEYMDLNPKDYYMTVSGTQHVNGVQAVAYARIRYVSNIWGTNNDYGRTDRQRYVMEQLFNKATKMSKSQYMKLAKALIPCSETSLSYSDILSLAVSILLKSPTFEQARIPQSDWLMTSPSGSFGSVVYYDIDYAAKAIHGMIYDDMTLEQFIEENPVEKNDWYAKRGGSSGSTTTTKPQTSSGTTNTPTVPEKDNSSSSTVTTPSTSSSEPEVSKPKESEPEDTDDASSSSSSSSSSSTSTPSNETTGNSSTDGQDKPSQPEGGTVTPPTVSSDDTPAIDTPPEE